MRKALTVGVLAVLALAAPGQAGSGLDELRSEAAKLIADGDAVGAARVFGEEIARLQKKGDLLAEREVAVALEETLSRFAPPRPSASAVWGTSTVWGTDTPEDSSTGGGKPTKGKSGSSETTTSSGSTVNSAGQDVHSGTMHVMIKGEN